MPLRTRLIGLIGLVLLISLAFGSVLVGWRAVNSVRIELRAALDVGAKTIRKGVDELGRSDDRDDAPRHLVTTFNGNRHVRAMLVDERGHTIIASELLVPAQPAPAWFRDLIGDEPDAIRFQLPGADHGEAAIILRTDPTSEIGEVWADSRDAVLVLAGFAALSALLIGTVVGRALRPLENLSGALSQIGQGHYHGTLRELGPPELARLASGFNDMAGRLAVAAAQNRRLNERLLTMQAEERADLARDLHDEIGPLLFAVDMTAATIEQLAVHQRTGDIPTHVGSIQEAVGRMQRHVRMLLGRLRPIQAIGLEAAIDRLAEFWRGRRPDITFVVSVSADEDRVDDDFKEAIYRVVQEGVSNAIRHGKPTRVEIVIAPDGADGLRVAVSDDGIGMRVDGKSAERDPAQLGLIGMRERVMAMAGSLSIQHGRDGRGMALVASLPCVSSSPTHDLDATE